MTKLQKLVTTMPVCIHMSKPTHNGLFGFRLDLGTFEPEITESDGVSDDTVLKIVGQGYQGRAMSIELMFHQT